MVRERIAVRFNKKNQNIRDYLFRPILKFLTSLNITANYLSNFKIAAFAPFVYFLYNNNLKTAYIFFLLSLLIDLFDGPLARYQRKASDKGKFIDTFGDYAIYLFIIISLIFKQVIDTNIGAYHLFVFPLVLVLATIKKQEFSKTDWIIKPAPELAQVNAAFLFFLFLSAFFNINYLNSVLMIANIYLSFLGVFYFIFIQFNWKKN
jgi:phosphatidylglycerophosphate synthase